MSHSYGTASNATGHFSSWNTVALPPETNIGEYTIEEQLGVGGFGITYLARHIKTGEKVVIKENMPGAFATRNIETKVVTPVSPEFQAGFNWALNRFIKEARLLAALSHQNIVEVYCAFQALGTAYYVMPWVGGKELGKAAPPPDEITEEWLSPLLYTLLQALAYLHEQNLLHRDIKVNNVLVKDDGTPIFIDFGAAKSIVAEFDDSHGAEKSMVMVAAQGYTPIEQLQTGGAIGPWSDIYALGATCYKLITGHTPPDSVSRTIAKDPYIPLHTRKELKSRFSASFLHTIDKALSFKAQNRWKSANSWSRALPTKAQPTVTPQKAARQSTVLPWGLTGMLAAACAGLVGYYEYYSVPQISMQSAPSRVDSVSEEEVQKLRQENAQLQAQQAQAKEKETGLQAAIKNKDEEITALKARIEELNTRPDQDAIAQASEEARKTMLDPARRAAYILQESYGIQPSSYENAFIDALDKGDADKLALLLDAGTAPRQVDIDGKSVIPLIQLVRRSAEQFSNGHKKCLGLLLSSKRSDINQADKYGDTALHNAVSFNNLPALQMLLSDSGINVNLLDEAKCAALHLAAYKGNKACIHALLSHPDIKIRISGANGYTPAELARSRGHSESADLLK